jgi:hypothetical protein
MNLRSGADALRDLMNGTSISPEKEIPEGIGTVNLFLTDGSPLWLAGAQRVIIHRDGHHVSLLVLLVEFTRESSPKDPSYAETDHLEDASYVVLSRTATPLERESWSGDSESARALRALEILKIRKVDPRRIILGHTQSRHSFIAHY